MSAKKIIALILAFSTLFTCAGCSLLDEKDDGKIHLTISWWGGESRHEATQAAVNAFMEKYDYIDVDVEFGAWTGWEDKMSTAFYAKTASDVSQVNWNWLEAYSADGSVFADLNNYSDILDLSQFDNKALEQCYVADKQQAVPVAVTGRIFYWNKAVYDLIGIDIPKNWEDLLSAGEKFRDYGEDYYPLVLGEYDRMIFMVYYLECKYGKDWVTDGKLNYSQVQIEEGLQMLCDLEAAHVIPTLVELDGDGAESLDINPDWINGKYAGIFEWDSSAQKFGKSVNENGGEFIVGDYIFPGDYNGGYTKISLAFAISETCKHKEEAAMLIEFLLNSEEGAKILSSERGIPLSRAAVRYCSEDNLLDKTTVEANHKVLEWCSNSIDPLFESSALKSNPDGYYCMTTENLSYGKMTVSEAAEFLINGIEEIYSD